MNDDQTPTETADAPETDRQDPVEPDAPDPVEPEKPSREAAKYRRQLRESQSHAEALQVRVEAMQRADVERLAATDLQTPGDLWLTDVALVDLLDDQGDVDPVKVTEAVAVVLAGRPGWARPDGPPGFDGGARMTPPHQATMQDLLQGRGRA